MTSKILLVALTLIGYIQALPVESKQDCTTIMYSQTQGAGIAASFPGVVAHGVHSLTLPDIHFYFPNNKTEIIMPIVNPDLLSFEPILFQPPDFQHSFSSPALRAVDKVLSHMNSPHFGMRLYTDLEKIVHATHMQDIWVQAGKVYQELQESKMVGNEVCHCIRDVENNGVVRMLRLVALKLREPGLMYGEHPAINLDDSKQPDKNNENKVNDWEGNVYSYHFVDKDQETQQAVQKINQKPKKVNDWEGNVYSYHFVDKDQETQQAVQEMNQKPKKVNDWEGNVYSYHFVDKDQETEEAVKNLDKNAKVDDKDQETKKVNDWEGNVYSYHFVDKDEETEQAVLKMKDDIGKVGSKYLDGGDGKSVKPLPHLESVEDWNTWKMNMLTMKEHMDEYSQILALYMHCMLK